MFQVLARVYHMFYWERWRIMKRKRILKGGQTERYLQPRIPMLSLALMWDNSSCRDKGLGDLFYLCANEYQVTATLTHLPAILLFWLRDSNVNSHTSMHTYTCLCLFVRRTHTLTLSMEASLRNSIRSSLSLLWFSSNTSEIHTQAQ